MRNYVYKYILLLSIAPIVVDFVGLLGESRRHRLSEACEAVRTEHTNYQNVRDLWVA